MDWQKIKDRVTEEVLRQLQAEQTGVGGAAVVVAAPPPAAPVAAPGVSAAAPAGSACATGSGLPACEVAPDFKTDVLAVVAGPVCDQVTGVLKSLAAQRRVTVVASGGVSSSRLADLQACGQFYCEGNEALARRLVESAGSIVVPVISTTVAAKVAGLIGDCLPSTVLVQAALAGKKAMVANESLAASSGAPWAIRRKVEEVTTGLRSLGFTITDLKGLAPDVKGPAPVGRGRPAATGFVPAYARPKGAEQGPDLEIARMIDHTLLKPEATAEQITKLCQEAKEYSFASVCVNPSWVPLCAKLLAGTPVKVCTVIGFPLGATSGNAKALEAADAIQKGATEVDMVLNVGALKSGQFDVVLNDITGVVQAAKGKALVKVILETGLLTSEEKVKACQLAKQAGADFVKTSTGFGPGGATVEDIALMRRTVGPEMGVKASGGIRDWDAAMAMVKAGATRIGASASVNIAKRVKPQSTKEKY